MSRQHHLKNASTSAKHRSVHATHTHTQNDKKAIEDFFIKLYFSKQQLIELGERIELMRRTVSGIMLILLMLNMLTLAFNIQPAKAESITIVVPDDYPTIQEAINAANMGDTILVRAGTYTENVKVNKSLTITSQNGPSKTTVQAADSSDHVFEVTADYVTISGFTVKGAFGTEKAGICLLGSKSDKIEYSNISNNILSDYPRSNYHGILLLYSSNNMLINNKVSRTWIYGIILGFYSDRNTLINNIATECSTGIRLAASSHNILTHNVARFNIGEGISLEWSTNNTLTYNIMSDNRYNFNIDTYASGPGPSRFLHNIDASNTVNGKPILYLVNEKNLVIDSSWNVGYLGIVSSSNITVKNLALTDNSQGLLLASSTNIKIENVTLSANSDGICLASSPNNVIVNNVVEANTWNGFFLTQSSNNNTLINNIVSNNGGGVTLSYWCSNNRIYHNNFVNNSGQVGFTRPVYDNIWDGNYPSGGNYWSDYTDVDLHSGPYQNETGSDGIWDHPYVIDANNRDRYPLVNPWTPTPTYVHGIDVSHHQGNIDWSQVYGAGYRFAFVKASEGVGWMDSNFVTNMDNGSGAGLLMGAYHFARPDLGNDAVDEALYFVSVARNYLKGGYLRPALDLEVGSSLGKEALSNWVHEWMETVKNEIGIEPIIYVNSNYANNYLDTSVAKYDLWIAHWTYNPTSSPNTGIWDSWDFWQYSNNGSVSGIGGDVDLDLFNGDMHRLYDAFANYPPVANFTYLPNKPKAGEKITFDASSSYDRDGEIISYEWDWNGDGDYEDYTSSPVTTFWWMEDGKYNVSLRVIDNKGAMNTISKEIAISKSSTSDVVIVLAAWWMSWPWEWPDRLRDHNDFVVIDRWLREFEPESKTLGWLGTKFASCTEADIVYIWNKEIDHSQAPGLTYKIHALNTIYEEELVHEAFWNSISPEAYYYYAKLIGELLVGSVSGLPTKIAEQAILDLSPTLGVGVSTLLLALKAYDVIDTFKKIEKVEYTWALGVYFWNRRFGENEEDAWNHQTSSLVEATINWRASEEEKQEILLATKWYFEKLWLEYEAHGREKTGLYPEFRKNMRDKIKSLLISALERYKDELPSRETAQIASPGELRVYDSQGRVTGVIKGEVKEEIPNSVYDDETKTVKIFWPSDSYRYEVQGTGEGSYGLEIASLENGQIVNFTATDIPISVTAVHQYTINWTALSQGGKGVTVQVDSEGDGVFEHTFTSDSELTQSEFLAQTAPPPLSVSISPLSASILVGQSVTFTSTVSGGYTPYSYQWYLNGNPVSEATANTWTFTPTTSGIYYVYLKVTDVKGNTAQSETARITVTTVPVGGYSIPIQLPTTAKPATIHIALLTILTAIFITIKRKAKRKH